MLQQPSDFIMYQKLPLDLNMHTAEVNNLPPDFTDISSLQLQAQRRAAAAAAATQAFFFDAYAAKSTPPSSAMVPPPPAMLAGIQGMYDLPLHAMYSHPIQAMYDPLRPHHQPQHLHQHHHYLQQQHQHLQLPHPSFVPPAPGTVLSTGPWQHQQQDSRGSWFPNWQEVFHGFAVGKDAPAPQEKQSMAPSFEQKPLIEKGVIAAPPVAAMRASINTGDTQQPSVHTDVSQQLDPCPLSPPPPQSHLVGTSPPHDEPRVEKKRDENIAIAPPISSASALASDAEAQHPCVDSDGAQLADPSPPLPSCSHSASALSPYPAPELEKGRENSLVPCTDLKDPQSPPRIDAIACKYTTQSPSWLPQGWITEVQTRRTGTTAGTRDKYYKDLVSGRRFRSRNEVIHFLQTGKGRLRKRRRRKALASSAFGGHHNLLSHQPRPLAQDATTSPCVYLAPQPIGFLLGPLVNPHPVQTRPNVSSAPGSVVEEVEAPCHSPCAQPTTSSSPAFMLGLKQQPSEVRPQKLPVQKKAKTLSPKKCEDKQASRLWQWLQKPVARPPEQRPEKQGADKQVNDDGKNAKNPGTEPQIAQKWTAQLGKEIETAQKTIMHLGKEMQATVEKVTRGIQTAQRDLSFDVQASHESDGAMSNVVEAAYRLESAMGNVTQATQNLVMAMGLAVQATKLSASNTGAASPPRQHQVEVIPEVSRQDMDTVHSVPRACTSHVAERPDIVMAYSTHAATQPPAMVATEVQEAHRPDVAIVHPATRGCATQPDLAMGYFVQACRMPDGSIGYSAEAAHRPDLASGGFTPLVQMPDITMHYKFQGAHMPEGAMCIPAMAHHKPVVFMSSPWTQASQSTGVGAPGIADVCGTPPLHMGELSRDTRLISNKDLVIPNLKLDLSMLSPSLSSRQRAKFVQRMKAKHARGLLVVLGRKLCFKALHKAGVRML